MAVYLLLQNFQDFSLFIATIDNINRSNQGILDLKVPICGNYATFCGILSKNLLPQPSFEEFHKSFHNLTEFFREQCSRKNPCLIIEISIKNNVEPRHRILRQHASIARGKILSDCGRICGIPQN